MADGDVDVALELMEKENLCLYGFPNEQWEVPPELPEPALCINFARDDMLEKDWLALVAVHGDAWLLAVAFYFGARFRFEKADRKRLFNMINDLPTIFEVVSKKQVKDKSSVSNHSSSKSKSNSKAKGLELKFLKPKEDEDEGLDDEEEEEEEEHGDTLCGSCGENYASDEFWICCDICEKWFHGSCVKITLARAEHIKQIFNNIEDNQVPSTTKTNAMLGIPCFVPATNKKKNGTSPFFPLDRLNAARSLPSSSLAATTNTSPPPAANGVARNRRSHSRMSHMRHTGDWFVLLHETTTNHERIPNPRGVAAVATLRPHNSFNETERNVDGEKQRRDVKPTPTGLLRCARRRQRRYSLPEPRILEYRVTTTGCFQIPAATGHQRVVAVNYAMRFICWITEKENLSLYGFPNEKWEVNLPAEEVLPELPEPTLRINFVRDDMPEKDWLALVAVHGDAWLLAVAFYSGARFGFDKDYRKRLFNMINDLPTIFEVVYGSTAKKQVKDKSSVSNHSSSKSKSNSKAKGSELKFPKPKEDEDEGLDDEEEEEHGDTLYGLWIHNIFEPVLQKIHQKLEFSAKSSSELGFASEIHHHLHPASNYRPRHKNQPTFSAENQDQYNFQFFFEAFHRTPGVQASLISFAAEILGFAAVIHQNPSTCLTFAAENITSFTFAAENCTSNLRPRPSNQVGIAAEKLRPIISN
ncbi:hypothetical protein LXL04_003110 [Taraxacum kok-saghyz]